MTWKKQSWKLGVLLAVCSITAWAVTSGPTNVKADAHGGGHAKHGASLHDSMETINGAYKFIARNMKDPAKRAECLAKAEAMLLASVEGRKDLPHVIDDAPEAQRAALTKEYRLQMCDLIVAAAKLEAAILKDDVEGVKEIITSLKVIKKAGHEKFIED